MTSSNQNLSKATEKAAEIIVSAIKQRLESHKGPLLVALDGRSGTGKSTLSEQIAAEVGATVIDQDDFYTGGSIEEWGLKSAEEKARDCIDWQRVRKDALEPLLIGQVAKWHPFNWDTEQGLSEKIIKAQPAPVIILDGAYSARPELADLIDLSIFVQASDDLRRARLKNREGEPFMESWHPVWDEAENYYFSQVRTPSSFDLVVKTGNT